MKPIIFCYLRTASRFLTKNFFTKTGIVLDKTHNHLADISGRISIGLVRNPQDSIASCLSQGDHFGLINEDLNKEIFEQASVYIAIYKKMLREADIIFPYDYLINNVDNVVEKISEVSGIEITAQEKQKDQNLDMVSGAVSYLSSSKKHEGYQKIYDAVMSADLKEAENVYKMALDSNLMFNQQSAIP